ncbi:MAG: 4-(cytidine 5'-diphospho)-2-C-methyl-D-erythritol kinase [Paludibacteraceae bacterium]|nr:4-(cytidine 5'-diphospho)-2-C-methyl-D-erythritol kinase [Paludibacteraceae bacterium]
MKLYPNAKINIGLLVGDTLPNGYHNIETIFYPIDLHDELEIVPTDGATTITTDGITLDCPPEKNLILKAYNAIKQHFDIGNIEIRLNKCIPFGAGLGGGSSDAAFTAYGLNLLFGLNLKRQQLADLLAPIGADCPFFVYNRPMLAQGIGDKLSPINLNLSGLWLLLVKPNINMPTAMAYKEVEQTTLNQQLTHTASEPIEKWRNTMTNAFEASVFPHYPLLQEIKEQLYAQGAVYASMTGTGAAIYGLFKDEPEKIIFNTYFTYCQKL